MNIRILVPTALAILLGLVAVAWWARHDWAAWLLVMAPSPEGTPAERPADVRRTLEVTRAGATLRAWVFEPEGRARGTVLVLHGHRDDKRSSVGSARAHAARGFRAVALDSRGHGESSGRHLTFGVEEARDLVALVDALERRGELVRPLAVVGTSYGGATALQYAALDRRVDAVVALAPFASLRQVVRSYLEWLFDGAARLVPEAFLDDLIDRAARRAGFDAGAACPRCVAPRITARVLLVHGLDDERVPWQHSAEIHTALASPSELLLIDGVSHVAIGRSRDVQRAIARWLDGP